MLQSHTHTHAHSQAPTQAHTRPQATNCRRPDALWPTTWDLHRDPWSHSHRRGDSHAQRHRHQQAHKQRLFHTHDAHTARNLPGAKAPARTPSHSPTEAHPSHSHLHTQAHTVRREPSPTVPRSPHSPPRVSRGTQCHSQARAQTPRRAHSPPQPHTPTHTQPLGPPWHPCSGCRPARFHSPRDPAPCLPPGLAARPPDRSCSCACLLPGDARRWAAARDAVTLRALAPPRAQPPGPLWPTLQPPLPQFLASRAGARGAGQERWAGVPGADAERSGQRWGGLWRPRWNSPPAAPPAQLFINSRPPLAPAQVPSQPLPRPIGPGQPGAPSARGLPAGSASPLGLCLPPCLALNLSLSLTLWLSPCLSLLIAPSQSFGPRRAAAACSHVFTHRLPHWQRVPTRETQGLSPPAPFHSGR